MRPNPLNYLSYNKKNFTRGYDHDLMPNNDFSTTSTTFSFLTPYTSH